MRNVATLVALFGIAALSTAWAEKQGDKQAQPKAGKHKAAAKDSAGKGDRYRRDDALNLPKRTEGHRPQDQNGDGKITRNEWPGDDKSFKELDKDGDGILSEYDRSLQPEKRTRSSKPQSSGR